MRHAKSSQADSGIGDHDRPLNERGIRDAPKMGQLLVEKNLVPEKLIFSSAKRTEVTANLLAQQFEGHTTIGGHPFDSNSMESLEDFYLAPWSTYVDQMVGMAADAHQAKLNSVMFLGHNPGIEMLIEKLTGSFESVPTATIAWVQMTGNDWGASKTQIINNGYTLMDIWRPKEL